MFPLGLEELAAPSDLAYMVKVFVLEMDNAAAAKVRVADYWRINGTLMSWYLF
jgi:hypothetical protein